MRLRTAFSANFRFESAQKSTLKVDTLLKYADTTLPHTHEPTNTCLGCALWSARTDRGSDETTAGPGDPDGERPQRER
jgi:hypothetical protein